MGAVMGAPDGVLLAVTLMGYSDDCFGVFIEPCCDSALTVTLMMLWCMMLLRGHPGASTSAYAHTYAHTARTRTPAGDCQDRRRRPMKPS
jgi:hypothetical protein